MSIADPTNIKMPLDWQRQRLAEDIQFQPEFAGDHAALIDAHMNWADLERFGKEVTATFPEAVFFPGCYNDRNRKHAPPPESIVPIYRNIVDCVKDPTHTYYVPRVTIRWPWANEFDSKDPDILAGRSRDTLMRQRATEPSSAEKWVTSRKRGRVVHIDVRFNNYIRFQDIETWNGRPYWAAKSSTDGLRLADSLPQSWCFQENATSTLQCGYWKNTPDKAYFCESIKRIWRKNTTDIYATYDGLTGEMLDGKSKSYEKRFGFNALKHGIDGTRRFVFIGYHKDTDRFTVVGPRKAHVKKAMQTQDNDLDFR